MATNGKPVGHQAPVAQLTNHAEVQRRIAAYLQLRQSIKRASGTAPENAQRQLEKGSLQVKRQFSRALQKDFGFHRWDLGASSSGSRAPSGNISNIKLESRL